MNYTLSNIVFMSDDQYIKGIDINKDLDISKYKTVKYIDCQFIFVN